MDIQAGLVGFSYPDYSSETIKVLKGQFEKAKNAVIDLGIDVLNADLLFQFEQIKRAVKDLSSKDIDLIIAVVPSICPPPLAVNTLKPFFYKPILLWGLPPYEVEGITISAAAAAGIAQLRFPLSSMGAKVKMIFGDPKSEGIMKKIFIFSKAAKTIHKLSESKIGIIGYADQGSYSFAFDQTSLRRKIGPEIEDYGLYPLMLKSQEVKAEEVEMAINKLKEWVIGKDISNEDLEKMIRVYLALKRVAEERGYDAMTMKCVYGLSRYCGMTPCVPLSLLGDEMPTICECDVLGLITQLILHHLTGQVSSFLELFDLMDDRILMGACGLAPSKLINGKPIMYKYAWAGFTGLMNASPMKTGDVTLARLASVRDEYLMHMVVGKAVAPKPWREIGWEITAPQYPSLEIILGEKTKDFINNVMAPHYHLVYGDHSEELIEFCKLLDIEVIS